MVFSLKKFALIFKERIPCYCTEITEEIHKIVEDLTGDVCSIGDVERATFVGTKARASSVNGFEVRRKRVGGGIGIQKVSDTLCGVQMGVGAVIFRCLGKATSSGQVYTESRGCQCVSLQLSCGGCGVETSRD